MPCMWAAAADLTLGKIEPPCKLINGTRYKLCNHLLERQ